jgi:DNA helicase HerA-like ATPase
MSSPMGFSESLRIGTVDFVSPDEIKVVLDIEAPDSVALNAGHPRPFPRLNSYVLVPNDDGYLVGQIEWLTVERSNYPKRKGTQQDFGLIDLPFPLRKMSLNPIGTLANAGTRDKAGNDTYRFRRGVDSFPSIGDSVLVPTQRQLKAIVESRENRRVKIGTSPLAAAATVMIDPDRLFGRHLAVLGNTGSGKSCSVAGLIQWSLQAVREAHPDKTPNARFIILDPNGEYSKAFKATEGAKIFSIEPNAVTGSTQLQVPLWFWNSAEWCAFTQASGRTQRPILRRALREIKAGRTSKPNDSPEEKQLSLRRYLSSQLITIRALIETNAIKTEESKFGYYLKSVKEDIDGKIALHDDLAAELTALSSAINKALVETFKSFVDRGTRETVEFYRSFREALVMTICSALDAALGKIGGIIYQEGPEEDCPIAFNIETLADHIDGIAAKEKSSQFVDFLTMRIRTMLSDSRMKPLMGGTNEVSLDSWLTNHLGDIRASNGTVTVIDLSLMPIKLIHITTAVIARMIFEALQRYRKMHTERKSLPTVLVMEEAHSFIKRYKEDIENQDASAICCQVFEKIAREGRKFGLGLVLSSQRPSELSPTVLSQCNSFLLHRINNDRDQEQVHKLIPDNLKGLLRDLPSLPSQHAILLGWASELPVLVRMRDLPKENQPQSDDPDFWDVWTGKEAREVDWKGIADDWQQRGGVSVGIGQEAELPSKNPTCSPSSNDDDDDIPF